MATIRRQIDQELFADEGTLNAGTLNVCCAIDKPFTLCYHHGAPRGVAQLAEQPSPNVRPCGAFVLTVLVQYH